MGGEREAPEWAERLLDGAVLSHFIRAALPEVAPYLGCARFFFFALNFQPSTFNLFPAQATSDYAGQAGSALPGRAGSVNHAGKLLLLQRD